MKNYFDNTNTSFNMHAHLNSVVKKSGRIRVGVGQVMNPDELVGASYRSKQIPTNKQMTPKDDKVIKSITDFDRFRST